METSRNSQWLSEMPMNLATKIANKFKQADMIYQATTNEGVRVFCDPGKSWASSEWANKFLQSDIERMAYLNWMIANDPKDRIAKLRHKAKNRVYQAIRKIKGRKKQRLRHSILIFCPVSTFGFQKEKGVLGYWGGL